MTNVTTKEKSVSAPLLAVDRCDQPNCSAQARTRAILKGDLQLLFCGHHTNDLRAILIEKGATLYEEVIPA
jgi:hypothetical protein